MGAKMKIISKCSHSRGTSSQQSHSRCHRFISNHEKFLCQKEACPSGSYRHSPKYSSVKCECYAVIAKGIMESNKRKITNGCLREQLPLRFFF